MRIEKPALFGNRREWGYFIVLIGLLLSVRLFVSYQSYRDFVTKPLYYTTATILNTYPKERNGRAYSVLKLHDEEGRVFFTSANSTKHHRGERVRLALYPGERIGFWDYVGSFYIKSRIAQTLPSPSTIKQQLEQKVASQHDSPMMQSFYQGIFFASPLSQALREKISLLGVSHLVALSGFHLGILWSLIYGLLLFVYKPVQQRYFPYRFSLLDVGFVTVLVLGLYLWFVAFPPSLVRSYAMVLVGWVVILLGMELLSFTFLTIIGLILLLLFPALLVSLGFWLSVAGVFYIFLLLHYTKGLHKGIISLLVIPLGIFVLMLPVVHTVFGMTTPYQLLSPLLSILFIPFYPLAMVLHLLGMGGLLDDGLLWLFGFSPVGTEKLMPFWAAAVYVGLSVAAIWSRVVFLLLLVLALLYAAFLFV